MPTARELLEQADALMRRNRAELADDIPVLTDAVPSPAEATRAAAAVPAPPLTQTQHEPPALTDAEPDPARHEGEPSAWLDFEDPEPSVIGDAPDSVVIVPPVSMRSAPDEELLQSAEHEEIELTTPADDTAPADEFTAAGIANGAIPAEVPDEAADAYDKAPYLASDEAFDEASDVGSDVASDASLLAEAEEASLPDADFTEHDRPAQEAASVLATPAQERDWVPAIHDADLQTQEVAAGPAEDAMAPPAAAIPVMPYVAAPPGGTAPMLGPYDQTHWDAVAEEIRMQVLQRIDLFTDTGLRERLGERLKPIVDRASADLVATINQHVGELLRAYVAEAIEREIERWRQDN